MAKRSAKGRYGEDDGKPIDVSIVSVGTSKADLDGEFHAGDRLLVVSMVQITEWGVKPVSESTLCRVHKAKALGATIVDDPQVRERLWKEVQAAIDAKKGQGTLELDEEPADPLDVPPDIVQPPVPDHYPPDWDDDPPAETGEGGEA